MAAVISVPGVAGRCGLGDWEWTRLRPPPPRARTDRLPTGHRLAPNALPWPARTGAPWPDLPGRFGPWRNAATKFHRWTHSGPWERNL
jgi:transposase